MDSVSFFFFVSFISTATYVAAMGYSTLLQSFLMVKEKLVFNVPHLILLGNHPCTNETLYPVTAQCECNFKPPTKKTLL